MTVDLRWKLVFPGGGGQDTTVQRNSYFDLASADDHLARTRFYLVVSL